MGWAASKVGSYLVTHPKVITTGVVSAAAGVIYTIKQIDATEQKLKERECYATYETC